MYMEHWILIFFLIKGKKIRANPPEKSYSEKMDEIDQSFSISYNYRVLFHSSSLESHPDLSSELSVKSETRLLVIVDDRVAQFHKEKIQQLTGFAETNGQKKITEVLLIPGGEQCKNSTRYLQSILESIEANKIDRHSYIMAIGGGALLDLAGFAASIAHRGIRLIRIPTTVLAQNDSGIGVKNGINYYNKKNFLGTFSPPALVINDSQFLTTLDRKDWLSGIAEAIKVALIKDAHFFNRLEQLLPDIINYRQPDLETEHKVPAQTLQAMEEIIYHCARLHLDHIAGKDPFEMGSSRPLDFGHWAAHKLEQLSDYELRHGEAVAIGLALDCTYSMKQGLLAEKDWLRIMHILTGFEFRLFHPALIQRKQSEDHDETENIILTALQEFREHLGGQLTLMMLKAIGQGIEVHEIDTSLMLESIHILADIESTRVPTNIIEEKNSL